MGNPKCVCLTIYLPWYYPVIITTHNVQYYTLNALKNFSFRQKFGVRWYQDWIKCNNANFYCSKITLIWILKLFDDKSYVEVAAEARSKSTQIKSTAGYFFIVVFLACHWQIQIWEYWCTENNKNMLLIEF